MLKYKIQQATATDYHVTVVKSLMAQCTAGWRALNICIAVHGRACDRSM